jgi:hypothetical protein
MQKGLMEWPSKCETLGSTPTFPVLQKKKKKYTIEAD